MALDLNFKLHPKQRLILDSPANEILFGGAAGGGKSYILRVLAIILALWVPGIQIFLFRRNYVDLIKTHLEGPQGFRSLLAPLEAAGICKIIKEEVTLPGGSKIYLCHCNDVKSMWKYQSAEMHVLLIDEAGHFEEEILRFLRMRVRMVGLNIPEKIRHKLPLIVLASNPGNIGHLYLKKSFIDPVPSMTVWTTPQEEGGMNRVYVPALLEDNPSILLEDPLYEARLQGLGSPQLVRALRLGDWDAIIGQYYPEFSREKHVVKPFQIPKHWLRFCSFDWGSADPFCLLWFAVSDGTLANYPRGSLIVYREWYGADTRGKGLKFDIETIGFGLQRVEQPEITPIIYRVAGRDLFKREGGPSLAERLGNQGLSFGPADTERLSGWDQIRYRLNGRNGVPMLYIFDTCVNLIRTLPIMEHDDKNPNDIKDGLEDHALDALRYGCKFREWIIDEPTAPLPIQGIEAMTLEDLFKKREREEAQWMRQ